MLMLFVILQLKRKRPVSFSLIKKSKFFSLHCNLATKTEARNLPSTFSTRKKKKKKKRKHRKKLYCCFRLLLQTRVAGLNQDGI